MKIKIVPTNKEKLFGENEIIVSKTDLKRKMTYVNKVFLTVSEFTESELIGQPHSMIRHPDIPRAVFKLFWDTILGGEEIFAYVKNIMTAGDHYWVLAHVTPTRNARGEVIGFHSSRRSPDRSIVTIMDDIYKKLLAVEKQHSDPRKGIEASYSLLTELLLQEGKPYDEFIWSLNA